MAFDCGETETESHIRNRRNSGKLLSLLRKYHCQDALAEKRKPAVAPPVAPIEPEPTSLRREYETKSATGYVPKAKLIMQAVAGEFGITVDQIIKKCNKPEFSIPRFVAVGLMLDKTNMSFPAIGRRMGRDHTTILSARNRLNQLLECEAFRNRYDQLKATIA